MRISIQKGDLFQVDEKYYLAHCISADWKLGMGIAREFDKRFKIRKAVMDDSYTFGMINGRFPDAMIVGRTINIITKAKYWHKPTYQNFTAALIEMREMIELEEIKYVAMPKIGCGLDRLDWGNVFNIIHEVFMNTDVEILIRYK